MRPLTYWQNVGYQITHPWHWLSYGNNAGAVGAAMAVFATGAAIIAGWLAWKSYRNTTEQLDILKKQYFEASIPHVVIKRISGNGPFISVELGNTGGTAINVIACQPLHFAAEVLSTNSTGVGIISEPGSSAVDRFPTVGLLYKDRAGNFFHTETSLDIHALTIMTQISRQVSREEGIALYKEAKAQIASKNQS